jgi:hypothetical protein
MSAYEYAYHDEYAYQVKDAYQVKYAYQDEYGDPYCDIDANQYPHPNSNNLTDRNQNRDTTDLCMGEFHECRCEIEQLCDCHWWSRVLLGQQQLWPARQRHANE